MENIGSGVVQMLNVVIVEDNQHFRVKLYDMVNKFFGGFKTPINVKTHKCYNNTLKEFINKEKTGHTIYLLDICLDDNGSGTDIANEIRKNDQDSVIIIITGRSLLIPEAQKLRLNILDYVCKQINFDETLITDLKTCCNIFKLKKSIRFSMNRHDYNLKFDDILYIKFNRTIRKTIIRTIDETYQVSKPLSFFEEQIGENFLKVNRGNIINFFNVKDVNYDNGSVTFHNNVVLKQAIAYTNFKMVKEFIQHL